MFDLIDDKTTVCTIYFNSQLGRGCGCSLDCFCLEHCCFLSGQTVAALLLMTFEWWDSGGYTCTVWDCRFRVGSFLSGDVVKKMIKSVK